jgi:hypothetical protein
MDGENAAALRGWQAKFLPKAKKLGQKRIRRAGSGNSPSLARQR